MKRRNSLFLALIVFVMLPVSVFASSYSKLDLERTLASEDIESDFTNYKETEDQITIYMFRGQGCGYCRQFLTFLNSIVPEYGKYFKLVSFEVWQNKNNGALMEEVADHLGKKISGVPFIVIGDKTFQGYHTDYDESIKEAIKTSYENKETYQDVVFPIMNGENKNSNEAAITIIVLLLAVSGIGFLIYMAKEPAENVKEEKEEKETLKKNEKALETKEMKKKEVVAPTLPKLKENKITVAATSKKENPKKQNTTTAKKSLATAKNKSNTTIPKKTGSTTANENSKPKKTTPTKKKSSSTTKTTNKK